MRGTGVSVLEFQTPLGRAVSEAINPRPNDRGRLIRQLTYLCYVIVLLFSSLKYQTVAIFVLENGSRCEHSGISSQLIVHLGWRDDVRIRGCKNGECAWDAD